MELSKSISNGNIAPALFVITSTEDSVAVSIPNKSNFAVPGAAGGLGERVRKKLPVAATGTDGEPVTTKEPDANVPVIDGDVNPASDCLLFSYTPKVFPCSIGDTPSKL